MEYWMKHPETTETTDGGDIPYGTGYRITAHSHGERVHEQRVEPVETVINDTIDLTAELDPSDGQEYIIHITDLANNTTSEYHLTAQRDENTGITDHLPFTTSDPALSYTLDENVDTPLIPREDGLFYEVGAEQYQNMLDTDIHLDNLSDTVKVDRRGYSPDVAEELGEDYLKDRFLVFGPEQQHTTLHHEEYTVTRYLTSYLYDDTDWLDRFTDRQPLAATLDIGLRDTSHLEHSHEERLFTFTLHPDYSHNPEIADRIQRIVEVDRLDQDHLTHHSTVEKTLDTAPALDQLTRPEKELEDTLAAARASNVGFTYGKTEGVAFSTEPLRVFTTEGDTIPDIDTSEDIRVYQVPHSLLNELDHDPHLRTHAQPHDIETWVQAAEQGSLPED